MKTTTTYFNDGSKKILDTKGVETWYDAEGNIHRANGPAITYISIDRDKNPRSSTYLENIIHTNAKWYWHGSRLNVNSQEEFQNTIRFIAFL